MRKCEALSRIALSSGTVLLAATAALDFIVHARVVLPNVRHTTFSVPHSTSGKKKKKQRRCSQVCQVC